ncbi:MAG: dihydrofolate reductase [Lachnospira sp.]|nr:dihydrofolate reductase [Lachnospira sp.]MDD5828560.1 dihydrofolate reductase [Lachnospira sp.]
MNIIAAVDKKLGIGKNGGLLVSIPEDMKLFREETVGKVVVMGRKTFESLPQGLPLVERTNIVLTTSEDFKHDNVYVCHSVDEVLNKVKEYPTDDVYVIGGASVYEQMLPYCDTIHLTKIDYTYDADTYFPDIFKDGVWQETARSDERTYFDICYEFVRYQRKA